MTELSQDDFEISIFVPQGDNASPLQTDSSVELHSRQGRFQGLGNVVVVGASEVKEQWHKTVDMLMTLSSAIAAHSQEWSIEEIEVGLTLSADGKLLFIAGAGAEASIKFTLKRKTL